MPQFRVLPAGDTALVVEFGDHIDRRLSNWVLALARRLDSARVNGVVETVPTIRSLIVHYDPLLLSANALKDCIAELMQGLHASGDAIRHWQLPACYDPEIAPDLRNIAERAGLSPARVVELHIATVFHVYMLGFLPGMAYLGDLPTELSAFPRMATPRIKVPAGTVAIANTLTCVYPVDTPGGWHLLARSRFHFLNDNRRLRRCSGPATK